MTTAEDRDLWERDEEASRQQTAPSPHGGLSGGSDLLDPERVARYAERLKTVYDRHNLATYAKAILPLVDEELSALRAENERLKRGGKTLGETIDKQCQMVLDATGLHDWVDEDGDGDWGAIWDHLLEQRPAIEGLEEHLRTQTHFVQQWKSRAEAAEAKVAKVEALHVRRPWDFAKDSTTFGQSEYPDQCDHCHRAWPCEIIAVLADAPAEHEWWDADHDRAADAYTPPERTYCRHCGAGRAFSDGACLPSRSRGIRMSRTATPAEGDGRG